MTRRAIIIAAGRGSRLSHHTDDRPKCMVEVDGASILEHQLSAYRTHGVDDFHLVRGYRAEDIVVPGATYHSNADWERNNILLSLFCAAPALEGPLLASYSDILFTPEVIARAAAAPDDISLVVDTDWRGRYVARTQHPTDDAEKVITLNGAVTRVHREIADDDAHGEYTGVAKFSAAGAERLKAHYHARREEFAGKPFREAAVFEKAYLIHLLQDMIETGVAMSHVDTHGGYMEIDTQQDYDLARDHWKAT